VEEGRHGVGAGSAEEGRGSIGGRRGEGGSQQRPALLLRPGLPRGGMARREGRGGAASRCRLGMGGATQRDREM